METMHPGFQGSGAQDKRPVTAVGRRSRAKTIQVSARGGPNPNQSLHTIPTPQQPQSRRLNPAQGYLKRSSAISRPHQETAKEVATKTHKGEQGTPETSVLKDKTSQV